jgi:hypothetical protein
MRIFSVWIAGILFLTTQSNAQSQKKWLEWAQRSESEHDYIHALSCYYYSYSAGGLLKKEEVRAMAWDGYLRMLPLAKVVKWEKVNASQPYDTLVKAFAGFGDFISEQKSRMGESAAKANKEKLYPDGKEYLTVLDKILNETFTKQITTSEISRAKYLKDSIAGFLGKQQALWELNDGTPLDPEVVEHLGNHPIISNYDGLVKNMGCNLYKILLAAAKSDYDKEDYITGYVDARKAQSFSLEYDCKDEMLAKLMDQCLAKGKVTQAIIYKGEKDFASIQPDIISAFENVKNPFIETLSKLELENLLLKNDIALKDFTSLDDVRALKICDLLGIDRLIIIDQTKSDFPSGDVSSRMELAYRLFEDSYYDDAGKKQTYYYTTGSVNIPISTGERTCNAGMQVTIFDSKQKQVIKDFSKGCNHHEKIEYTTTTEDFNKLSNKPIKDQNASGLGGAIAGLGLGTWQGKMIKLKKASRDFEQLGSVKSKIKDCIEKSIVDELEQSGFLWTL